MQRFRFFLKPLAGVLLTVTLAIAPALCGAQAYPAKTITIVVPFTSGGTSDVLARKATEVLRKAGGHPVLIDNKPGAGGTIASRLVARAKPDGYTLI